MENVKTAEISYTLKRFRFKPNENGCFHPGIFPFLRWSNQFLVFEIVLSFLLNQWNASCSSGRMVSWISESNFLVKDRTKYNFNKTLGRFNFVSYLIFYIKISSEIQRQLRVKHQPNRLKMASNLNCLHFVTFATVRQRVLSCALDTMAPKTFTEFFSKCSQP